MKKTVTVTKLQREQIIQLFLNCPDAAKAIAIKMGLAPDYAYKLTRERGLLPIKTPMRIDHEQHYRVVVTMDNGAAHSTVEKVSRPAVAGAGS